MMKIFSIGGVEKGIGGILHGSARCGAAHSLKNFFTIQTPYGKLTYGQ